MFSPITLFLKIHGRTREQRYTKLADWEYIEECAKLAGDIPVFGNGDILTFDDYYKKLVGIYEKIIATRVCNFHLILSI